MPVLNFFKTTLFGGLIVILPVTLAAAGIVKAVHLVREGLAPIVGWLPDTLHYPTAIAALCVLAACFLAGILLRTAAGRALGRSVERGLLEKIPGYALFRTLSRRIVGEDEQGMAVVLVALDDAEAMGFLMERTADGKCVVFVPSAPTPAVGTLMIVSKDRVKVLEVPIKQALGCFSKWGVGSGAILAPPPHHA